MTDRPEGPAERRARVTRIAARALVRLYPRAFRRRFGRAMVDDLARMVADGRSRAGTRGAAAAWVRAFRDLGRSLPAAWRAGRGERGGKHGRVTGTGGTMRIGAVVQDVRWAARGLRRSPGFTVLAVGVLAVAVAGVATGAALVDAYLLQGLPYPAAERLVSVAPPTLPWDDADPSVVEHALTWDLDVFTLVDGERPELVRSAWISPGFQEGFGLTPALGRLFRPDEFREGAAPVALLGHALWQGRYGGDPGIVGRSVTLYASDRPDDAEVFTVVGVLPRDFWYHNAYAEMLAPLRRPNPLYMARLRPGVPLAEAERTLTAAARRSGAEVPPEGIRLRRLEEAYTASVRPALGVLGAAALLVLLLACSNTAVLQLVRAAGREQELSVRRALGAGRARIARHLLSEGLLLAGAATGLGLLAAAVLCGLLAGPLESRLGVGIPGGAGALAVNGRVTVMAVALGGLAGLGFGLASFAGVGRGALGRALAEGGRSASNGVRRRRLRNLLVGTELALSLTLLVGAGLALRSARHLATLDLGFRPEGRVTAEANLRAAAYPDAASRSAFYERLAAGAARLPGVASAGLVSRVPFGWRFNAGPLEVDGAADVVPGEEPRAITMAAGRGLLETLGIPLLRGRDLSPRDGAGSAPAALVSRELARRAWPGRDPIGGRVRPAVPPGMAAPEAPAPWWTVVGVVEDIVQDLDGDAPDLYVSYAHVAPTSMTLVLELTPGAAAPWAALEDLVRGLDPEVAIASPHTLDEVTLAARAPSRFLAVILGGFSAFALVLAVLGLYGVVAYAAARRSRDVAVRMALGAEAGQVVALFVRESLPVLGFGLLAGLAGAALLARALAGQLRGVSPWDAQTWAALPLLLSAAALVAAWLPARRAAAADPAVVLRE